jgi:hypothetical protein
VSNTIGLDLAIKFDNEDSGNAQLAHRCRPS